MITTNDTETCICGNPDAFFSAHWKTPTSATVVAFSCSEKCETAIENLRNASGVLTVAMVRRATKKS